MTTSTTSSREPGLMAKELPILREAQLALTAAIAHAREESLEPAWHDQLLGLRLRLEKDMVKLIAQQMDQLEGQR